MKEHRETTFGRRNLIHAKTAIAGFAIEDKPQGKTMNKEFY
jgi:hypothetical protein